MMDDNKDQTADADVLKREAMDWVVHLTSGDATIADVRELRAWREQSPDHAQAFSSISRLWHTLGSVAENAEICEAQERQSSSRAIGSKIGRRAAIGGFLAAGVTGYMVLQSPLGLWPRAPQWFADYQTGIGERRHVTLPDGVKVELNTASAMNIKSSDAGNTLQLLSGEAMVEAAADAARPVVVEAGGGRCEGVGSGFNLRTDDGLVRVTCLRGKVAVHYGDATAELTARQQMVYGQGSLGSMISVDPTLVVAWQQNMLIFRDERLSKVISEVNRYWHGRIVLMRSELGGRRVTARFNLDRLNDVVPQMQSVFGLHARVLPGGVVLLS